MLIVVLAVVFDFIVGVFPIFTIVGVFAAIIVGCLKSLGKDVKSVTDALTEVNCSVCRELIKRGAQRCKHCGEPQTKET